MDGVCNHVKLGSSLRVPYFVVDAGYGLGRSLGDCRPALLKGWKYQMVKTQTVPRQEANSLKKTNGRSGFPFPLRFTRGWLEFVTQAYGDSPKIPSCGLQGVPHQYGLNQYEFHQYAFSKSSLEIQLVRFCIKNLHLYDFNLYDFPSNSPACTNSTYMNCNKTPLLNSTTTT